MSRSEVASGRQVAPRMLGWLPGMAAVLGRGRSLATALVLMSASLLAPPLASVVEAAPALPLSTAEVSVPTTGGSMIDAGFAHTCAIRTDGTLSCWGSNGNGQTSPPPGIYTAVSAGGYYN